MTAYHSEPPAFFGPVPTQWEEEFADTLSAIFAGGVSEKDALVRALENSRVRPPDGGTWTVPKFETLIARLAGA